MKTEMIFRKLCGIKVGVIGDFCVDAYYVLDEGTGEISLETGLRTRSVRQMRFEPGGASNVAKNLKAIGAGSVHVFGLRGDDIYGRELERIFTSLGIDCTGLVVQKRNWDTNTYSKLYSEFSEEPRIDIGNFNIPDRKSAQKVLSAFEKEVHELDAVIINQQLIAGINTPWFRKCINKIIANNPDRAFIVDSRSFSDEFAGAMRKINLTEAAKVLGIETAEETDDDMVRQIAGRLYERWGKTVFITRGGNGLAVKDGKGFYLIPGIFVAGATDTVGAGDALIAGVSACLAAGLGAYDAGMFGNACAAVTVSQRFTAGTPFPADVAKAAADPDYVYNAHLAADERLAKKKFKNSGIEIIRKSKEGFPSHIVFDHDGTISTLREGWEDDMAAVMVESIAGDAFSGLSRSAYELIVSEVKRLIDSTTGIRTIEQMKSLVSLIRHFGIVQRNKILEPADYKRIYMERLEYTISGRMKGVEKGLFAPEDFTIKGAIPFIRKLRERGATLYLASGTDEAFVKREARMLGYADAFNGGILGASDTADEDPKRIVMKAILGKISGTGNSSIAVFGDGPVELREAGRAGALAVGVASDEVRRYGFNHKKRSRLVLAGADAIIPDYSDIRAVFSALGWRY